MLKTYFILIGLFLTLTLQAEYYCPAQDIKSHLWGYIDQKGKNVTKFKYRIAFNFSYSKAIVLRDKWYFLDKENLQESPFDGNLQKYFNTVLSTYFKSEKLKYYEDNSNYLIYNFLIPNNSFSTGYYYHLFHLVASDIIQLENKYSENKSHKHSYSLYNIFNGYVKPLDDIQMFGILYNNKFTGIKRRYTTSNNSTIVEDSLGIFDENYNLIVNLNPIKNQLLSDYNGFKHQLPECPAGNELFSYASIATYGNNCLLITVTVGPKESCPEWGRIDSTFVYNIDNGLICHNSDKMPFEKYLSQCACSITYLEREIDSLNTLKEIENQKIYWEGEYSKVEEISIHYYSIYANERINAYNNSVNFFTIGIFQSKSNKKNTYKFLWGVWDGDKFIIKPKYQLMGVYN